MVPVLEAIAVYPVKSCRAVPLVAAVVAPTGLEGDRVWQVVDDDQSDVTQRQHPALATVQPTPLAGGLRLEAPGLEALVVEAPAGPVTTTRSHFGLPVAAVDAGDRAAEWFSTLVGSPVRLVRLADQEGWRLPDQLDLFGQGAAFSDAAPVLVTATASLDHLRERADEPFGMDRFRPNLVVRTDEAWDEDTWAEVRVGEAHLRAVLPWPRCAIPQVDQQTGRRTSEPARVLRAHRWCTAAPTVPDAVRPLLEGNALFGVACSIGPSGVTVQVGDPVVVERRGQPVL